MHQIVHKKNTEKIGIMKKINKGKGSFSQEGFKLFLLVVPFLVLLFIFSYFPLYGWSYAFFKYKPGLKLSQCEFVGLKNFMMMFMDSFSFKEIIRVMKNTLGMSFLGILTSPLAIIFALFINEIRFTPFKKVVQTLTTIPNFISWVLVYAVAYSMFSVNDGFVNRLLVQLGVISDGINILASQDHVWLTMLGYSIWKSLGWSAIIYIASIASIDQELYEAARVDGAGRFRIMWHITVPELIPTYFVLLILSIAGLINNGMEQYYVFQNPMNKSTIEVLDLYVYNLGILGSDYSFSTAVSMLKSIISILLLFFANNLSKLVRKESVI